MRLPKQKKPKIETVREQSETLAALGKKIIAKLCPVLKNSSIEWVMVTRQSEDGGKVVEPRTGEKMGTARAAGVIDRLLHHYDFRIVISGNWWAKLTEHQRQALVYHELCHCFVQNGKPTMQKHEFEGFVSELKHFGPWAKDLEAMAEVLQLKLVEDEEVPEVAAKAASK